MVFFGFFFLVFFFFSFSLLFVEPTFLMGIRCFSGRGEGFQGHGMNK